MSAARILVVDDEADIRGLVKEILTEEGYEVEVAADAGEARTLRSKQHPDLILLDIWMPDVDGITLLREWMGNAADPCPVVMMSGHGTVDTAVEATRLGAVDFVEKPLSLAKLLRTVERGLEQGRKRRTAHKLKGATSTAPVGKSRPMQELRAHLQRIAQSVDHVLLIGERGSGREAFARYLHEHGPRAARPFVVLVASALREADAELVLSGLLDQTGDGTLFINEIGDLPAAAQRVLLGILETGRYHRVGERTPQVFAARLLASAQEPLPEGVRSDLLAQVGSLSVRVPPLRDYAEDVPDLLRHSVDRLVDGEGLKFRRFGIAAQNRLRNYPWPGNLQELRTLVRRMLLQGGTEEISLEEIERELVPANVPAESLVKHDLLALSLREAREHFERAYLQQQLQLCQGKVGQLAKRVGMERTHLYRKLRALGIDFRGTPEDVET